MSPLKRTKQTVDAETAKLLHSLQAKQLELERENKELRLANERTEVIAKKYVELYDSAPVGYIVLSKGGEIVNLNLHGSKILGKEGKYLLNSCFNSLLSQDTRPIFDRFLEKVFACGSNDTCEVKIPGKDIGLIDIQLECAVIENADSCLVIATDITAQKLDRKILSEKKMLLDKSQEIAHLGTWEFNVLSGQLIWSDEVYRIFGFQPNEIVPAYNVFLESVYPDDRQLIDSVYFKSLAENKPGYEFEHRIIRRHSREMRYVFEKCEHIRNSLGQIVRSVGIVQDITETKMAEISLRESEEKFRSFIQFFGEPMFSFNRDETYRFVNESFANTLGKTPEEIIGKTPYEIFSPDEAEKRLTLIRKVFQTGEKGEIEVVIVTPSGEDQYYLTTVEPFVDELGEIRYVNCVSREFTQLKKTDQALKESEARIKALLAAIPDMIFVLNRMDGVFIDYHGFASNDLYAPPEYFLGKNIADVLPANIVQEYKIACETAFQTNHSQSFEYCMALSNKIKYYESKVVSYDGDKILSIVRDVSKLKEEEETIKLRNEALQRINGEKDKLFSIIAHDLRGPFSGLLGLTEMLSKRLPSMTLKEIQEISTLMRNSAVHLYRLLSNLLEWSTMQRKLTVFVPKSFLLREKIDEFLALPNLLAHQKEIQISYDFQENLKVFADENMFESIIRNLVSNAVKFTPKGGRIAIFAKTKEDQCLEISVKDTGIGMNKKLISQLFRIDIRSNRKGTDGEYSSGLGLLICRDFIEKHGGTFEIESSEGNGSTFRFTLPANRVE